MGGGKKKGKSLTLFVFLFFLVILVYKMDFDGPKGLKGLYRSVRFHLDRAFYS